MSVEDQSRDAEAAPTDFPAGGSGPVDWTSIRESFRPHSHVETSPGRPSEPSWVPGRSDAVDVSGGSNRVTADEGSGVAGSEQQAPPPVDAGTGPPVDPDSAHAGPGSAPARPSPATLSEHDPVAVPGIPAPGQPTSGPVSPPEAAVGPPDAALAAAGDPAAGADPASERAATEQDSDGPPIARPIDAGSESERHGETGSQAEPAPVPAESVDDRPASAAGGAGWPLPADSAGDTPEPLGVPAAAGGAAGGFPVPDPAGEVPGPADDGSADNGLTAVEPAGDPPGPVTVPMAGGAAGGPVAPAGETPGPADGVPAAGAAEQPSVPASGLAGTGVDAAQGPADEPPVAGSQEAERLSVPAGGSAGTGVGAADAPADEPPVTDGREAERPWAPAGTGVVGAADTPAGEAPVTGGREAAQLSAPAGGLAGAGEAAVDGPSEPPVPAAAGEPAGVAGADGAGGDGELTGSDAGGPAGAGGPVPVGEGDAALGAAAGQSGPATLTAAAALATAAGGTAAGAPDGGGSASQPDDELDVPERLRATLEAVLLVVDQPTNAMLLAQVLGRPLAAIEQALRDLRDEYDAGRRGLDLREVAGGWRLYTRDDFAGYVERFVLEGQATRLTQAALETLAVIAYRQPITRSRVSAIRGVNVDAVMRTLLSRGLVEECGSDAETGGGLYRTTQLFLERLGISSLEELPSLAPLLPDTSQLDDVALST